MPDNDQKNVIDTTPKRVTVVFAPQTYKKLEDIAKSKGITNTEALRQSISLTEYLDRAQQKDRAKIFIERDGKLSELIIP